MYLPKRARSLISGMCSELSKLFFVAFSQKPECFVQQLAAISNCL